MSHIEVHLIEQRATNRIARTAQITAGTTRTPRTSHPAGWPPDRPRPLRGNYRSQQRVTELDVGETIDYSTPSGTPLGTRPPQPAGQAAYIDYGQQQTYALSIDLQASAYNAATTDTIPFPFIVTNCVIRAAAAEDAVSPLAQWNLLVVDVPPPDFSTLAPSGTPLIITRVGGSPLIADFFGPQLNMPLRGALATGPIGSAVADSGKRLSFVVRDIAADFTGICTAIVTVAPFIAADIGRVYGSPPPRPPTQPSPPPDLSLGEWEQIY